MSPVTVNNNDENDQASAFWNDLLMTALTDPFDLPGLEQEEYEDESDSDDESTSLDEDIGEWTDLTKDREVLQMTEETFVFEGDTFYDAQCDDRLQPQSRAPMAHNSQGSALCRLIHETMSVILGRAIVQSRNIVGVRKTSCKHPRHSSAHPSSDATPSFLPASLPSTLLSTNLPSTTLHSTLLSTNFPVQRPTIAAVLSMRDKLSPFSHHGRPLSTTRRMISTSRCL